jgi:hypothetical protein
MAYCLTIQTCIFLTLPLSYFFGSESIPIIKAALVVGMAAAIFVVLREAAVTGKPITPRIVFALTHALSLTLAPGLWGAIAINGANHWLSAIGIAAHVDGRSRDRSPMIFAAIIMLVGFVVFWLLFWNGQWNWNLRLMMRLSLGVVCLRLGIGFVHFLYDRWVWKLSDPQVRATIGQDLLWRRLSIG